jgi:hypothetical protein
MGVRGDKPAAIAAYTHSLKARQNGTVRARLATLDPAAAAALDPFLPRPMGLHDETLAEICETELSVNKETAAERDKDYPDGEVAKMRCTCKPKAIEKGLLKKPPAPYRSVRIFQSGCERGGGMSDNNFVDVILAVQLADGFYWETLDTSESGHYCWETFQLVELAVRDVVPGGAPEIVVRWSENHECRSGEADLEQHLRVLGIGPSGKPSITPIIDLGGEHHGDDSEDEKEVTSDLADATFDARGQLVIKADGAKSGDRHTLVFP